MDAQPREPGRSSSSHAVLHVDSYKGPSGTRSALAQRPGTLTGTVHAGTGYVMPNPGGPTTPLVTQKDTGSRATTKAALAPGGALDTALGPNNPTRPPLCMTPRDTHVGKLGFPGVEFGPMTREQAQAIAGSFPGDGRNALSNQPVNRSLNTGTDLHRCVVYEKDGQYYVQMYTEGLGPKGAGSQAGGQQSTARGMGAGTATDPSSQGAVRVPGVSTITEALGMGPALARRGGDAQPGGGAGLPKFFSGIFNGIYELGVAAGWEQV